MTEYLDYLRTNAVEVFWTALATGFLLAAIKNIIRRWLIHRRTVACAHCPNRTTERSYGDFGCPKGTPCCPACQRQHELDATPTFACPMCRQGTMQKRFYHDLYVTLVCPFSDCGWIMTRLRDLDCVYEDGFNDAKSGRGNALLKAQIFG